MKVLLALPGELYQQYLAEFTRKYPEEVTVVGNAEAFNLLMQMHDQEKPDVVIFDAGLPGTTDPDRYAPKSMVDMIQHVRRGRAKLVMLANGILVKEKDRVRLKMNGVEVLDGNPVTLATLAPVLNLPELPDFQKPVISVFSLKGGIGKSSVAANLAVRLAAGYEPPYDLYSGYLQRPSTGLKVLVWDLDFQSSDARLLFNVPPELNLYTLFRDNQLPKLDLRIITQYIYTHSSGVDVFAAPPHNVQIRGLNDPAYASVLISLLLKALQQVYHVIIFDLPNEIITRPHVEAALKSSNMVLHVLQPNKRAAKAAKEGMYWLERLGKKDKDVFFVMNRLYDRRIDMRPFTTLLEHPIDATLPELKNFDAMQDGGDFPAVEDKGYADGLSELIGKMLPNFLPRKPEARGSFFGTMFTPKKPKPKAGPTDEDLSEEVPRG